MTFLNITNVSLSPGEPSDQSFPYAAQLVFVSASHSPSSLCSYQGQRLWRGPVTDITTSPPRGYEPPPTCLLPRFMWLRRRRPIQPFSAEWDSFYADSCVYDTVVGSETGSGPVCLRSVINESLKRLGQFSQDKWWKGRTANVRTQTLQDDGVISHLTPHTPLALAAALKDTRLKRKGETSLCLRRTSAARTSPAALITTATICFWYWSNFLSISAWLCREKNNYCLHTLHLHQGVCLWGNVGRQ